MDKETLSNYGWIVICVLVISVMIALATPFGQYVKTGVDNTTQGLFDVENKALNTIFTNNDNIETYEYSQVNQIVNDYLTSVSYDANDYTESFINDFASVSTTYRKDQPSGLTVDLLGGTLTVTDNYSGISYVENVSAGPYTFYNITPGIGGEFKVEDGNGNIIQQGHLRPSGSIRMIYSNGTYNIRDLGGLSCDGGTVKYGKIYRSGAISDADEDLFVNKLGIRSEIDLRDTEPHGAVLSNVVKYVDINGTSITYTINNGSDSWVEILNEIFECAEQNKPLVFHCSAGRDRTGTVACIIEAILGISQSDIDKDYELTCFYINVGTNVDPKRTKISWSGNGGLIPMINAKSGDTFRDKVINWVIDLGFTKEQINNFRLSMIDGTPEIIS